jgi:hypothetical protein
MNGRYVLFLLVGFAGLTVLLYAAMGISQQRTPTPPDAVQVEFFSIWFSDCS